MPKLIHKRPAYCHHEKSNRGRVCIAGKYHYLPGAYDSAESRQAYWAMIGQLERGELGPESSQAGDSSAPTSSTVPPSLLTVAELVEKYKEHVDAYYRQDGMPTGEHNVIKYALRPLLDLCPAVLVSEFRPSDLKTVRQEMIARGWSRRHINHSIRRIKTMFTWGVEAELLSEGIAGAVKMVKALREGRSGAREKAEIGAVSDSDVEAILPFVSPIAGDMIELMKFSGCRPGEVRHITVEAIDRTDPVCWVCTIDRHKTSYIGRRRTLYFGPKCQAILSRWIIKAGTGRIFPLSHSGLRTAIARACDRAGIGRFGPNRLRHRAGTEARKHQGLEGAQHFLGHAHASTTEIYAESNAEKARQVAMAIG